MMSNPGISDRQHAYSGPELPQLPEPSYAERVCTLLFASRDRDAIDALPQARRLSLWVIDAIRIGF